MTQQTYQNSGQNGQSADPFAAGEKIPSLSFNGLPAGTTFHFTVTGLDAGVQTTNFESGELEYWPDGNKKLANVITAAVDEFDGDLRTIWARKPSALYRAFQEASKTSGIIWGPGVRGTITYTGEKPNEKNPRLNPQKLYAVTCQAPRSADAFAEPVPSVAPAATAATAAAAAQAQPAQPFSLYGQPAQPPAPVAPSTPAAAAIGNLTPEQIAALIAKVGQQPPF
jgi:hypothetical protein